MTSSIAKLVVTAVLLTALAAGLSPSAEAFDDPPSVGELLADSTTVSDGVHLVTSNQLTDRARHATPAK
mgnify:CR=1 FL=1